MFPHTRLVLLRQSFFGLAWLAVIVTALSVSFASQRNDLVVAITNHFLRFGHLLWNNWAMFFDCVGLIDVRITEIRQKNLKKFELFKFFINSPLDNSIFQFFLVDFLVRWLLACVARGICVSETLSRFLAMHYDVSCAIDVTVGNRETIFDLHRCAFGENFLQSVDFLKEQVAVGVGRAAAVAGLRQVLDSFDMSVAVRAFS